MTLSTPYGRTPAVDPLSLALAYNHNDQSVVDAQQKCLDELRDRFESTTPLADLDPAALDVVFVVGGHGPMQDLAVDPYLSGFAGNAPWLLEDRLRLAGANYVAKPAWTPHAVTDGNLVTGQQNYSAQVTADAVMKVLTG